MGEKGGGWRRRIVTVVWKKIDYHTLSFYFMFEIFSSLSSGMYVIKGTQVGHDPGMSEDHRGRRM